VTGWWRRWQEGAVERGLGGRQAFILRLSSEAFLDKTAKTNIMHAKLDNMRESTASAINRAEEEYFSSHAKVLSRVWILMQICTIALVISGFALGAEGIDAGYGFIGVWVALMSIFLSVVGALVLRKYRNPLNYGILGGLSFMMSQCEFYGFS